MQRFSSPIHIATRLARPATALRHCRRAAFQANFHPAARTLHTTLSRFEASPSSPAPSSPASATPDPDAPALPPPSATPGPAPEVLKLEPRLQITFTCTADECGHRSTHEFTKRSYESGIVIVQCPGCKNRHLLADHMGWFKEITEEGQQRTVEDIMRAKGETVRRGRMNSHGGVTEYAPE